MFKKIREEILFFGDILLVYIALFLTILIRFSENFSWTIFQQHLLPFSFLYIFWFILFYIFGLYDINLIKPNKIYLFIKITQAILICLIVGIIFFYLTPFFDISPKTNLIINGLIFGIFIFIWRQGFYQIFSSNIVSNVAFLGKNYLANDIIKEIETNSQLGYKFIKFLDLKKSIFNQLKNSERRIDELVILQNSIFEKKFAQELYKCISLRINITDFPQMYEKIFYKIPIDILNKNWFLTNLKEGEKKIYDKIKRIEDIIFASLMICLTIPLWLLIAALIKLEDKKQIFYKEKRIGKDRKIFTLWKFRSMKIDTNKKVIWPIKNDPRITKIGKFLRKTHLDELPQLINILKGDISLIGPRPEKLEFAEKLEKVIPYYRHIRYIIKPGLTGWAQIKFKYAYSIEDFYEKFKYDLYYIKNRSFFLDISILLKTFQLFFKEN